MRPRTVDYLQPGEEPILVQPRHPLSVLDELLGVVLLWAFLVAAPLVAFSVAAPALLVPVGLPVVAVVSAGMLWLGAYRVLRCVTSLYVVTPERVYEAHGRLWFHLLQTTYDKVTDLHLKQSFWGRRFGFGTVRLETAGTGLPLVGIRDPMAVKRLVEATRTAFVDRLVHEHRRTAPAHVAGQVPAVHETPSLEDTLIWQGRPVGASVVGQGLGAGAFLAIGASSLVAAAAGPAPLFTGVPMLLVGLAMAARIPVFLATTRYEVRSRGVVVTSGWLSRRRIEATYEKVTDINTRQGPLGRLLDFGTISIRTAGGSQSVLSFAGLHRPEGVKALMDQARSRRTGGP